MFDRLYPIFLITKIMALEKVVPFLYRCLKLFDLYRKLTSHIWSSIKLTGCVNLFFVSSCSQKIPKIWPSKNFIIGFNHKFCQQLFKSSCCRWSMSTALLRMRLVFLQVALLISYRCVIFVTMKIYCSVVYFGMHFCLNDFFY